MMMIPFFFDIDDAISEVHSISYVQYTAVQDKLNELNEVAECRNTITARVHQFLQEQNTLRF